MAEIHGRHAVLTLDTDFSVSEVVPIRGLKLRRSICRVAERPFSRVIVETERALRAAIASALASGR
jgi:hypothetical protein